MAREKLSIEVTERGARVVEDRLKKVGVAGRVASAGAAHLTRNLQGLALGFAGTAGLITVVRSGIRVMRDFGQEISTVAAITGATGAQFDRLEARARQLGATTRFTGAQAAEGMGLLARAGFTATETIDGAGEALLLAQAGALDLASAANITAATIRGFRLEVSDTSRVVDVLAKAAATSNTNVIQLGEGLKLAAPVSAGLGVSVEETTAAISALSDAGLQATLAGTGLRRIMAELESPSRKTVRILREFGLTEDNVRVSSVGLTEALSVLRRAGVDTGTALELFGQRGGPAFEVLSSNIPRVKEMTEALSNAEGTARNIARVMDDNLNGAFLRTTSAAEDLAQAVGGLGFEDALIENLERAAGAFRNVSKAIEAVNGVLPLEPIIFDIAVGPAGRFITGGFGEGFVETLETVAGFFRDSNLEELQEQNELLRKVNQNLREKPEVPLVRASSLATGRELGLGLGPPSQRGAGAPALETEVGGLSFAEQRRIILGAQGDIRRTANAELRETIELMDTGTDAVSSFGEQFEVVDGKIRQTSDDILQLAAQTPEVVTSLGEMTDPLTQIEEVGVSAFRNLSDSFGEFVATGKTDILSLAQTVIAQLARVQFELALVELFPNSRLIQAAFGRQFGGPFRRGDTAIVGERGPERVTFGAPGRVDPLPASPAPSVNIVNTFDAGQVVSDAIAAGAATDAIVNFIAANPDLVARAQGKA